MSDEDSFLVAGQKFSQSIDSLRKKLSARGEAFRAKKFIAWEENNVILRDEVKQKVINLLRGIEVVGNNRIILLFLCE